MTMRMDTEISEPWKGPPSQKYLSHCLGKLLPSFLPGQITGKESAHNAGDARDTSLIPGSRRSPGGGNGNLFQYSCLGNPMDRGAQRATQCMGSQEWDTTWGLNNNSQWRSNHDNPVSKFRAETSTALLYKCRALSLRLALCRGQHTKNFLPYEKQFLEGKFIIALHMF